MFFSLLRQWIVAPFSNYRLTHNFARQDFFGQFAGSLGGIVWLFVTPVVNILLYAFVFSVVFRAPVPENFGGVSFIIFLMLGYLPWHAFGDAIGRSSSLLLDKAPLITKVMFPVQIIPVVGTLVPYMVHGIGLLLFLLYLALKGYFSLMWLWMPLVLLLQFLFTMGLVAILSALCVFLRDIQQIVTLTLTAWFFLTPIIYPITMIPEEWHGMMALNPMHHFIQFYRELILLGEFSLTNFAVFAPVSILTWLFGGWIFMRIKHTFGDVL